ncbi:rhamnulokinase [Alicyclobacillus fastidiosus]|uniref:Rhamnulokinase family protein n=1 Tax=Alicyclobacillus fastidiosus TaxID=392011 RepID=A0ABV5AIP1_9BACL|nr:rhamnulokinase family protein [Alicyclobacillus fastidiosus]WEH07799.1 rhamnulokinase [Alicyclobacillus fastidiosus]
MQNLLAVDLGASSGRVMRAAFNGDTLSLQEVRRFQNKPLYINNRMHWNIYSIFQEIKEGILDAVSSHGAIRSLAIDSWAVDFGLVDSNGHLLDLPRHYRDARNGKAMENVVSQVGKSRLFGRTGIQLQPFNTLYQLYAMKQENENLLEAADTLLLIPDLLNFLLTGEKYAEFSNATTTQFLNAESREWDHELLSQLQLPSRLLPTIVKPGTGAGLLKDDELLRTQLLGALEVIHTTSHDTASAVVSVPSQSENYAYISSGTWSLVGTVVPKPIINEKTAAFNFTNEGGLGNYRLLKNVMGLWLVQETQRTFQSLGEPYDIERLVHRARLASPFRFMFDPDDSRLLQPGDIPETIRQICRETGQRLPDNSGSLIRGIFESLALKYRYALDQLELITGERYDAIHIIGGGSQNQLLSQFTANATNRPVIVGPVEASAMGNVLVQLLALGEVGSTSQMSELVQRSVEQVTYVPHENGVWESAYEKFTSIIEAK